MLIHTIVLAAATLVAHPYAQQPSQTPVEQTAPDVATLDADLGRCSADFLVKDSDGAPVYAATIHVRVRYGAFGIKRADLEVGTNSDGKARIKGLPDKARPLTYVVTKEGAEATAEQDLKEVCEATFDLTLEP